jgi:aquaglyceroporin related protein
MDVSKAEVPAASPVNLHVSHVEHKRSSSNETNGETSIFRESGPTISRSKTKEAFTKAKSFNPGLTWPRIRHMLREPFSEFLGTFILIGDGVVAQVVLSNGEKGDYQSISWGWVSCHLAVVVDLSAAC